LYNPARCSALYQLRTQFPGEAKTRNKSQLLKTNLAFQSFTNKSVRLLAASLESSWYVTLLKALLMLGVDVVTLQRLSNISRGDIVTGQRLVGFNWLQHQVD